MRRALLVASLSLPALGVVLAEEPKVPEECKSFAKTRRATLASVWGSYAWKHAAPVSVLAFSADGRSVIAGDERTLVSWERASGREQKVIGVGGPSVLSPDGKKLLVAGAELALGDLASGKVATLGARAKLARFSHDGKRIIALSGTTATVLEVEKGKEVRALHLDAAADFAALSPDGKRALVGDARRLVLHDLHDGKKLGALESDAPLAVLVWDADLLVTGARDGKVRAWDPEKLSKPLWERAHQKAIVGVSVAGKRLAALSEDGALVLRSAAGDELAAFEDPGATAVALAGDGLGLASAGHSVKLWSLETRKRIEAPDAGHEGPVLALAVSFDRLHVLSGAKDHTARVWNLAASRELRVHDQKTGAVTAVAFSPDGKEALTANDDGSLELFDTKEGADLHRFADVGPVGGVGFGPGVLRAATSEGQLVFFERTRLVKSLERGTKAGRAPSAMAGKHALLATEKGVVKVWNVESGAEVRTLDGQKPLRAVAASPSGKRALTGGAGFVRIFDLAAGTELRTLESGPVTALAVSADDKRGLSASEDGKVVLWDLDTGKQEDAIDLGPRDHATALAFHADGFLVGTARGVILRFTWSDGGP